VSVEGHRRLEPQRVPCPEARRHEPCALALPEQRLEDALGVIGLQVDLEAVGARVAGARHQGVAAGHLEVLEAVAHQLRHPGARERRQHLHAGGSLERQQAGRVAHVANARLGGGVVRDPAVVLLDVRRVHAEQERVVGEPVDGDVVHDATLFVAHQRIAHAAGTQRGHGAGQQPLGRSHGAGALQPDLPHVRYVEQARRLAHRPVLLDDRGVLHRHREACEHDHARAQAAVDVVQRGPPRLRHAPRRAS